MKIVDTVHALRRELDGWRQTSQTIGFAPTMGNLHAGHLSLIDTLRRHGAERIVASIFVNPLQFGGDEDFATYPRTMAADQQKLKAANVDLLFAPSTEAVYPPGHRHPAIVDVPGLSSDLCGASRPGHFAGVATVVVKLFNMVQPDMAVFGEKDYQQLMVIKSLVECLCYPIDILSSPTMREADGLAISSRNQYLTKQERDRAPLLHAALVEAKSDILSGGQLDEIERSGISALKKHGFEPDYFAIRAADDLTKPADATSSLIILAAARLGSTRLIDNLRVGQ